METQREKKERERRESTPRSFFRLLHFAPSSSSVFTRSEPTSYASPAPAALAAASAAAIDAGAPARLDGPGAVAVSADADANAD